MYNRNDVSFALVIAGGFGVFLGFIAPGFLDSQSPSFWETALVLLFLGVIAVGAGCMTIVLLTPVKVIPAGTKLFPWELNTYLTTKDVEVAMPIPVHVWHEGAYHQLHYFVKRGEYLYVRQ